MLAVGCFGGFWIKSVGEVIEEVIAEDIGEVIPEDV